MGFTRKFHYRVVLIDKKYQPQRRYRGYRFWPNLILSKKIPHKWHTFESIDIDMSGHTFRDKIECDTLEAALIFINAEKDAEYEKYIGPKVIWTDVEHDY